MIQRVSELDHEPIVGKHYLVPCIIDGPLRSWRPVIGPPHNDIEHFNFKAEHYHYDWRFLDDLEIQVMANMMDRPLTSPGALMSAIARVTTPKLKRLKCLRRMPEFGLDYLGLHSRKVYAKFEQHYASQHIASCLKCPHRGMDLSQLPQDAQGNVVCNGHGLSFNLKTRRLVSRLTEARG